MGRDQAVREQVQAQVGVVRSAGSSASEWIAVSTTTVRTPRRSSRPVAATSRGALVLAQPAGLAGRVGPELRVGYHVSSTRSSARRSSRGRSPTRPASVRPSSPPQPTADGSSPRRGRVALDLRTVDADFRSSRRPISAARSARISSCRIAPYSFSSRRPSSGSSPPPSTRRRARAATIEPRKRRTARPTHPPPRAPRAGTAPPGRQQARVASSATTVRRRAGRVSLSGARVGPGPAGSRGSRRT